MSRFPRPFFRRDRKRWYVQLDGKQINLGAEKKSAHARYHDIMVVRASKPAVPVKPVIATAVVAILDEYMEWLKHRVVEGTKAQRTLDWYDNYLQLFAKYEHESFRIADLTIEQLQPVHIYHWVDSQTGWKSGKRGAMTAVQRAFNWAAKAGLLKSVGGHSPIASLEKPPQGRREQLIVPERYRHVLTLVKDEPFRDLLELAWETGCRPQELFTVEATFVDLSIPRWIFPLRLSKGRKVQRVIYLSDRALEITRRLMIKNATGPMLRNNRGRPWCREAVNTRFKSIRNVTGEKFSLYCLRHSYCTAVLEGGQVDAITLSQLMGHRNTQMISRFYSHLDQRPQHMCKAARIARTG